MELSATTLTHAKVRLEPFEERHRAGLIAAAHADASIFRHIVVPVARDGYGAWFDKLRAQQAEGSWLPFAVIIPPPQAGEVASFSEREGASSDGAGPLSHRAAPADSSPVYGGAMARIVGQSCYINPRPALACVEIGGTWVRREAQGTAINPAAKLLLLGHAFACGAARVELKTDALNAQSRAAMEKLGCVFEGVQRRQMRRADGSLRDNAWFSVIAEDWPALRARIEARLAGMA